MSAAPIAHIGVLVSDVAAARANWSRALGGTFSPIVRYRPAEWRYRSEVCGGSNDLRQTIYIGVDPSIEIQQFVSNGTHAPERGQGGHHLGFPPVDDNVLCGKTLCALGVDVAAEVHYEGRPIIQFTEARDLNNVSTEWVELSPGHLDLKDDGSPVDRLPTGEGTVFEPDAILNLRGERPWSGIVEIGIVVDDLDRAAARWAGVTGRAFALSSDGTPSRTALSEGPSALIRLVEASDATEREGISHVVVETDDLGSVRERLRSANVPPETDTASDIQIEPAFLNGVSLRYRACPAQT